jgi:hypothetical protein
MWVDPSSAFVSSDLLGDHEDIVTINRSESTASSNDDIKRIFIITDDSRARNFTLSIFSAFLFVSFVPS